jgi:hypothetical protein
MLLKPFDVCTIIIMLSVVVFSFFFVYTAENGRSIIALKAQNGEWVFPINADETVLVSGPLGDTIIEIHENGARIASSPCMNQTCVATGIVHSPGQWTACLPNRVMLYISESGGNDVDATAW